MCSFKRKEKKKTLHNKNKINVKESRKKIYMYDIRAGVRQRGRSGQDRPSQTRPAKIAVESESNLIFLIFMKRVNT